MHHSDHNSETGISHLNLPVLGRKGSCSPTAIFNMSNDAKRHRINPEDVKINEINALVDNSDEMDDVDSKKVAAATAHLIRLLSHPQQHI